MNRRLLQYLRPHAGLMVATVVSRVVAAVLDAFSFTLLIPFLNLLFAPPGARLGLDDVVPDAPVIGDILRATVGAFYNEADQRGSLLNVIIVMLATVVAKNFFVWWGGQTGARLQEYVSRDMRDSVFAHVIRLPMTYHSRTKVGQVLSRVLSDTDQTKQVITQLVTQGIQSIATIAASVFVLFQLSTRLSLISLVVAPVVIVSLQPLLRRLRRGYRKTRQDLGELTSLLQEVLAGARLVKSYGAEGAEQGRFTRASGAYSKGLVKVTRYAFLSQPITEIIGTVVAVWILWVGAQEVFGGSMRGADLIAFLGIVLRLLQPLKQLSQVPAVAQGSLAAAERLFEILDQPTEAASDTGTRDVAGFTSELRFENVSFDYGAGSDGDGNGTAPGARAAVSGVSLTAKRNEIVAIVGPSGAGKSTLVDLVPRFYEPTSGVITLDGIDLRDIRLAALRRLIGIVSQETILFNDTVRSNIAFGAAGAGGDRRVGEAEIERVARLANAHEFIEQLPRGYDTILGERGTFLSGGQRQRLSIARALLANPPILIFDEATSALDTESERLVQEAIDRLLEGRTVFVIAHRISTIMHADQILVLDRGRVAERGTHAELLARDGLYARLHSLQFREPPAPARS